MPKSFSVESIADAQSAIRSATKIRIKGCGTKDVSMLDSSELDTLDLTPLSGIIEYDPSEFTITARAGTSLRDIRAALAERGQFLPFDPPLIDQGATVGGMIASGISGPCRMRFGGVRDFVLGVTYLDGTGAIAHAGGKVVKNAAGFDIPKMLVGSWGELAAIVEATLKVFPRPACYGSMRLDVDGIEQAIALVHRLTRTSLDIDAIDIEDSRSVLVRMGGSNEGIAKAATRITEVGNTQGSIATSVDHEEGLWSPLLDWSWCKDDECLVRVPLTTSKILKLESLIASHAVRRRYSTAGNLAWIAWPKALAISELDKILHAVECVGRIVRGTAISTTRIGLLPSEKFASRVRCALDPDQRFARRM